MKVSDKANRFLVFKLDHRVMPCSDQLALAIELICRDIIRYCGNKFNSAAPGSFPIITENKHIGIGKQFKSL